MRNYHDNLSLFVDRRAAKDFREHMKKLTGQNISEDDLMNDIDEENSGSLRRRKLST